MLAIQFQRMEEEFFRERPFQQSGSAGLKSKATLFPDTLYWIRMSVRACACACTSPPATVDVRGRTRLRNCASAAAGQHWDAVCAIGIDRPPWLDRFGSPEPRPRSVFSEEIAAPRTSESQKISARYARGFTNAWFASEGVFGAFEKSRVIYLFRRAPPQEAQ